MRIDRHVHLAASGGLGFDLTDRLDCNVFALEIAGEIALVDIGAGRDTAAIAARLEEGGVSAGQVRYVLITHAHADHCGGAADVAEWFPQASLIAHPFTAKAIEDADEQTMTLERARAAGFYPRDYVLRPAAVAETVMHGSHLALGDVELEVLETPGHETGTVSYAVRLDGRLLLFSGDVVFRGGRIMLQSTRGSSVQDYVRTIAMLDGMGVDAMFPGHGEFSLRDAARHIRLAQDEFDLVRVPPPFR